MQNKSIAYNFSHRSTVLVAREGEDAAALEAAKATEAVIQKKIDDAVAARLEIETKGLKAKNDELLGKMKVKEDALKKFDGFDVEQFKQLKERLDADEDAKMLAEGKKHLVIEKYTERMRAAHQQELEAAANRVKEVETQRDSWRGDVLNNQIRSVAVGLHPGAVEDALLQAQKVFTLDAKGKAVQLDSEGMPVLGKDGKTPFSPQEWMEMQKELKPHWFLASNSGGGSQSAHAGSGQGKTIKRSDFNNLPSHKQGEIARSGTKIID